MKGNVECPGDQSEDRYHYIFCIYIYDLAGVIIEYENTITSYFPGEIMTLTEYTNR